MVSDSESSRVATDDVETEETLRNRSRRTRKRSRAISRVSSSSGHFVLVMNSSIRNEDSRVSPNSDFVDGTTSFSDVDVVWRKSVRTTFRSSLSSSPSFPHSRQLDDSSRNQDALLSSDRRVLHRPHFGFAPPPSSRWWIRSPQECHRTLWLCYERDLHYHASPHSRSTSVRSKR